VLLNIIFARNISGVASPAGVLYIYAKRHFCRQSIKKIRFAKTRQKWVELENNVIIITLSLSLSLSTVVLVSGE